VCLCLCMCVSPQCLCSCVSHYVSQCVCVCLTVCLPHVTHELQSIFAIGNNSVFLDPVSKAMIASGSPRELLAHSEDPRVRRFLTRGEEEAP